MLRPLAMKPPSSTTTTPAPPNSQPNQTALWNSHGPLSFESEASNFGYASPWSSRTGLPSLDTARDEFRAASAHGRQRQRDRFLREEAITDYGILEARKFDAHNDDDISDPEAEAEEHSFATSLAQLQSNIGQLRDLATTDGTQFDIHSLLHPDGPQLQDKQRQHIGRTKRFGRRYGPRKPAEPTPDITLRTTKANNFFLRGNMEEAEAELWEIIRINAETPRAWETLAAVSVETNKLAFAAFCHFMSAHFQPKITSAWMRCIDYILYELEGTDRSKCLKMAKYASSAAVRAVPKDMSARMKNAEVYLEIGSPNRAISEYQMILKHDRTSTDALGSLAYVCAEHGNVVTAIEEYQKSLPYFKSPECDQAFGWGDADNYIMLYVTAGQTAMAMSELRSVARWLLGRGGEGFWDDILDDDREWDITNERRIEMAKFDDDAYHMTTYGQGLPLEFRANLGLLRLELGHYDEAMKHLGILLKPNEAGESHVAAYPGLFLQTADKLLGKTHYEAAMKYYQPLKDTSEQIESSLLVQIGKCFLGLGDEQRASDTFKEAIEINEADIDARMELARMYEQQEPTRAFNYVTEVIQLRNNPQPDPVTHVPGYARREGTSPTESRPKIKKTPTMQRIRGQQPSRKQLNRQDLIQTAEHLQNQYRILKSELESMRNGDVRSSQMWMDAAKAMTDDFRSFKTFYPWDKYIRFLGYSGNARVQAETSLDSDLTAMAERLSKDIGADISTKQMDPSLSIPEDYRGISFQRWLDIFLEYALCLARNGSAKASYDICEAARDAVVFYHSREDVFLIQLCWCMCALFASDEETCVSVARFFMKDYQFATDSYRMFAVLSRACHSPVSWYSSGPTQKFILRQIKAMDWVLVNSPKSSRHFSDKGSYSAVDSNGHIVINKDMDIALLMLYGHILFTSGSYTYALNYFFRAYALDPKNPMISLNIGLAYVHHSLKRQIENRQYFIIQGFGFMQMYYESRTKSLRVEERQEAHYNMARAYHMLGLVQLAIPYYLRVLEEKAMTTTTTSRHQSLEDVIFDSAYNLQVIYGTSGNFALANGMTARWLTI